ncbi:hypothetical protein ACJ73_08781 [Blastomyces percursus]|uniref:Myb-like domain-containing protein n=1 Tax=Blastomyces percursus TaxID=1658174 RepID=A0A1J9QN99_9EURO|nr:hypothetical protein ACJ73_08781 [Blastomyces percursus]
MEEVDMSSSNSIDQDGIEPSSLRAANMIQGSTAADPKPWREILSGYSPQKADRSSSREITSPLPDNNTTLDRSELRASCQPPGLVDCPDQHLYASAKLPGPEGSQEQTILMDSESDGEDSPNDTKSKIIGPAVRTGATARRGIADGTASSTGAKSELGTSSNPGKCDGGEHRLTKRRRVRHMGVQVVIPSTPDAFQGTERRGDRQGDSADPGDDSDFNNSSACSEEEEDDDHVTSRSRKQRKLSTRSSMSTVSSTASTLSINDPSSTVLINDKKPRTPTKYCKILANDSHGVTAVPQDNTVTSCSCDDIPVSGFLSSYLSGSKVCYTITFYHEKAGQPLSAKANGLSSPSCKKQPPVTTSLRVPFALEDDALLRQLKGEGKPWDEIAKHFPGRSKATLQVRYSTKLKDRASSTQKLKPRPARHGCH